MTNSTTIELASKLGIRILDAERYLAIGLTSLDVEVALNLTSQGITLDNACEVVRRARDIAFDEDIVIQFNDPGGAITEFALFDGSVVIHGAPLYTGTIRRTKRFTSLGVAT